MNVDYVEKYRTRNGATRYRARWSLPSGVRKSKSFERKKDAEKYLERVVSDRLRGIYHDPTRETLAEYAPRWLTNRTGVAPRTIEAYESTLGLHIFPRFGTMKLGTITVEMVREWRAERERTIGAPTAAKAYRLLRTIMGTAEEDGLIPRNPCRVKSAAVEKSPERPLLTVEQVAAAVDAIAPRYRALVLLGAFGALRRGELLGLRVRHFDEVAATVRVEGQAQRVKGQGRVIRKTKSDAGIRTVHLPPEVVAELAEHVATYCTDGPDGWLFTDDNGSPVRETTLANEWGKARKVAGIGWARLHDLRHFAGTLATQHGYTVREVQARLGHSTNKAAMIYQHASEQRDRELAAGLGAGLSAYREKNAATVTELRAG